MSGHSKWHTIKHKKGAADAKRGKIFTRLIKELTIGNTKHGGGDPDMNPRLRTIIADAKAVNMPADNIKRGDPPWVPAKKRGVQDDEVTYEGYGPGGVAIIIETMTDNRNRTVGEIRHTLSKFGGNLGEANSVAWMFERKSLITLAKEKAAEDTLDGSCHQCWRRRPEGRGWDLGDRLSHGGPPGGRRRGEGARHRS